MPYVPSVDKLFSVHNMVLNSQPEFAVDAAANYVFQYWKQPTTKTLSAIKFGLGNTSGTPTSAFSWELFNSDITGTVGSTTGVSGTATPSAYQPVNPTGLSQSLTGGNYYGILIKNVHATPASNYFGMLQPIASPGQIGWGMKISKDSGTTYDDCSTYMPPLQLYFSDTSRMGVACMRSTAGNSGNNAVYTTGGSRLGYFGSRFRAPGRYFLHKALFMLRLNGTLASAGSLTCKVFRNITDLGASVSVSSPSIVTSGNRGFTAQWATPILIEPDSDYSVVLSNSGGSSSHHWLILGTSYAGYTPTGTTDCDPWGLHSVSCTGGTLSSWTTMSEQWFIDLAFSPALRA